MASDAVERVRHLRQYGFVIEELFGAQLGRVWYAVLTRPPGAEMIEVRTVWITLEEGDVSEVESLMVRQTDD
jgi:hypothetical protein